MIRNTQKACLKAIGKDNFEFDYEKELEGYKFLCGKKVKKDNYVLLRNDERYSSYSKWKGSIVKQYKNCSNEFLVNFSRYLNQGLRNTKPNQKVNEMIITALVAFFFTFLLNIILKFKVEKFDISSFFVAKLIIAIVLVIIACVCLVAYVMNIMITPIWEQDTVRCFWKDYKEIIDQIIQKNKQ